MSAADARSRPGSIVGRFRFMYKSCTGTSTLGRDTRARRREEPHPDLRDARAGAQGYGIARNHVSHTLAAVHGIRIDRDRSTGGAVPGRDGMALAV